jgi:predicted alpha/beta superfamily hydrolase
MIRLLLTMAILACVLMAFAQGAPNGGRVSSLSGDIRFHEKFASKVLGNQRTLRVYLPPQYKTDPTRKFSVLYMHDGQNLFDGMTSYIPNQEWKVDEAAEALIDAGMIEPIIIVGIDNGQGERGDEYVPIKVKMGGATVGGKTAEYGKFLVEEVMPFINQTYRTQTGRDHTGLCGSSFGGVITIELGNVYPDVFGRLGIVSPSLWIGDNEMNKRVAARKNIKGQRVWIDMGTGEANRDLATATRELGELYRKTGTAARDVRVFIDPRAEHNEPAWARRFPLILLHLFGKR